MANSLSAQIAKLDSLNTVLIAQVVLLDSVNREMNTVKFGVERCIEYVRFSEVLQELARKFPGDLENRY